MIKHLRMYYFLVGLPYVLLLVGAAYFIEPIKKTILNNPIPHLNYAIIVIVLTGGIFILNNARRLVREARMLKEFTGAIRAKTDQTTLRGLANGYTGALACILQMIATSSDRAISHQEQAALEHELTNTRSSLVRRNALPQYLTGLLVAMGLLGTFIGLLSTLGDISVLIGSFADLDMNNVEPIQIFRVMIERMKAPMTSMGIAFSTSMFGLLGSIIIGLMMLGIRRLQGDIISVLSSEVARHIEIALSFESISFRGGEAAAGINGESLDLTAKILLRIEERLAEAARLRQRALSNEVDDFKKQRADMMRVLSEQTEASNNFCSELQQLGNQLGNIFSSMEKRNSEISNQISELTVRLAGDAKETHKLLAAQVEEQRQVRDTLNTFNVEEWMAETVRLQQRALAAEIDDFKKQRAEMVQALNEQSEGSRNFRSDLKQLSGQLEGIFNGVVKGSDEISAQISELKVHMGADVKESHRLMSVVNNNVRSEMQKLDNHLGNQLDAIAKINDKGNIEMAAQISKLMTLLAAEAKESKQLLENVSSCLNDELKQLGGQIDGRLGAISSVTKEGNGEISGQISKLLAITTVNGKASQELMEGQSNELRSELQRLGKQLGSVFTVTEKGSGVIAAQVSQLMMGMAADAKETQKLLSMLVPAQDPVAEDEQAV